MSKGEKISKKDDSGEGVKSISNSQKTAGKRAALRAKQPIVQRGGMCPACGQNSTSCTTGTEHAGCERQNKLAFNTDSHLALATLAARSGVSLFADGSPRSALVQSIWLPIDAFKARRDARETEAKMLLAREIHVHVAPWLHYTDGNGTLLYWDATNRKYILTAPPAAEDPGLMEKVSIEETLDPIVGEKDQMMADSPEAA